MKNLNLLKERYRTLTPPGKALVWVSLALLVLLVIGGCK